MSQLGFKALALWTEVTGADAEPGALIAKALLAQALRAEATPPPHPSPVPVLLNRLVMPKPRDAPANSPRLARQAPGACTSVAVLGTSAPWAVAGLASRPRANKQS